MSYPPSAQNTPAKLRNRTSSTSNDQCVIVFRETSKSTDSSSPFSVESISNVDDAYRIFFKHHTCYDLVPLSAKLIVFDVALNVKKGFFALVYNGVRVAILWDSETQCHVGLLTITDFIRILHKYYRSPETPIVELEEHQIKTWREQMADYARPLVHITPERTLLDAVRMLLENKVHRLPIMDPQTGNPLHILTHKRLLKYLHFSMPKLPQPTFMEKQLKDLSIGTMQNVICVETDWQLHRVLAAFIENRVSALPVVDADGCLVDIYAKFDVINLAATRSYDNLEISVFDALQYRREKFSGVATCTLANTLKEIIDTIVDAGVHRLVVVDEARHVLGIVSLSDILRFLIQKHSSE
uniref:5'-AMP-activated protein kinase subunit gamma-1 n=1 Tax=Mesocestoides corti TaxID=53468 RepID=A0A5K3ES05_MESCO